MAIRHNADGSITVGIIPEAKPKKEPTPQEVKAEPVAEVKTEAPAEPKPKQKKSSK